MNESMKNLEMYTCYRCKYFSTCGDPTRTEPCNGQCKLPTENQCKEIARDIIGMFGTGWCVSTYAIAERMGYSVDDMELILWECVKYPNNPITRADGKFAW